MTTDLYKLVYCSRNLIRGTHAEVSNEIAQILASSRKNNMQVGITGALLYNAGMFAQVLEGPMESIERIFEAIQSDPRHSEVVVVESGATAERDFPDWSMAFTGTEGGDQPAATAALEAVYANSPGAGEKILSTMKNLVMQENEWILLDR